MRPTESTASLKIAQRERLISDMEVKLGLASEHEEDKLYTNSSPQRIVEQLKGRTNGWTVERVMIAFIRSACAAHRKTNCLTEILFEQALAEARRKDQEFAQSGQAEGAFWGLPSSFKDTFNITGVDSSIGCSPHCFKPTKRDDDEATLVKMFRKGGGIPFCKTNVPQTLLAFECSNPVFGATSNPFDSTRTCGGSSGGEAALVTLSGTPIGWGSDIGGSLRIPAHYTGTCGLKSVKGRWPTAGQTSPTRGFDGVKSVVGPMARNVLDLRFATEAMLALIHESEESRGGEVLIPLGWRDVEIPKKLRVGYWTDDGAVKTSPACARAVFETAEKLRELGHDVVEFQPPDVPEAMKVFAALTSAEGYAQLLSNIGSDPMEPSMRLVTLGSKLPSWLHALAVWIIYNILKDTVFATIFATSKRKSAAEYWEWTARRDVYAKRFNQLVWEDYQFDMLLCPVQAVPALRHGETKMLSPLAIGTILFNVVGSTVGVLPVTRVDPVKDILPPDHLINSRGSWILEGRLYRGTDPAYDAAKMANLPVGVQIVGKAWEEEKVLGMMSVVESASDYR